MPTRRRRGTLASTGIEPREAAMITNPHLMLELHAARVVDLRAEAAHDRLVRALRLHASEPAHRWWRRARVVRASKT
jgi:hypothetical protein